VARQNWFPNIRSSVIMFKKSFPAMDIIHSWKPCPVLMCGLDRMPFSFPCGYRDASRRPFRGEYGRNNAIALSIALFVQPLPYPLHSECFFLAKITWSGGDFWSLRLYPVHRSQCWSSINPRLSVLFNYPPFSNPTILPIWALIVDILAIWTTCFPGGTPGVPRRVEATWTHPRWIPRWERIEPLLGGPEMLDFTDGT